MLLVSVAASLCTGRAAHRGRGWCYRNGLFNWIKVGALELGCEGAESCLFGAREVLFVTTGRAKVRQPHVSEGV